VAHHKKEATIQEVAVHHLVVANLLAVEHARFKLLTINKAVNQAILSQVDLLQVKANNHLSR